MIWIKTLFKSGGSSHITIPRDWLNRVKAKFNGGMPAQVEISEIGEDLLVKALKPKVKGK